MSEIAGTLSTGYTPPDGETPQTAGDVSAWYGVERGESLSLVIIATFAETTRVVVQATNNPVGGWVKDVATLSAQGTTTYQSDEKLWYRVYFYVQAAEETVDYTLSTLSVTRQVFKVGENGATVMVTISDAGMSVAGTMGMTGNVSIGTSSAGSDLLAYGADSSYLLWDASAKQLILSEGVSLVLNDTATTKSYQITIENGVLTPVEV